MMKFNLLSLRLLDYILLVMGFGSASQPLVGWFGIESCYINLHCLAFENECIVVDECCRTVCGWMPIL